MKCFEFDQLAAYVDEILSVEEKKHMEKHLEFCPSCREVLSALQKEDTYLQEAIQSPVLPAGFDDEVLSKLEPYQVKKKKRNWPYQLLTAASIVLALGVGAAFYSGTQVSDGGNASLPVTEEEEKEALFSVKEEGVLLEVTDIIASPLKIEVFYRLKPEEWVLEDYLKKHNVEHISQIGDEYERMPPNGKIFNEQGQELPFREVSWGRGDRFEDSIVIKPAEVENLPDLLRVDIEFDELFLQEGQWKLGIHIDISEAKAQTSTSAINEHFNFESFDVNLMDWETTTNAHRLTLTSEYTSKESERLQNILNARGEGTEEYSMIMPELSIVEGNREQKLVTDGISSYSHMGQSFTTEYEFTNRINSMELNENLSMDEELKLILEGFWLHEPENTQFNLTDQSEIQQVNDWIIETISAEPDTANSKKVTITGRTSIKNIDTFIVEVKGDERVATTESISIHVTQEGTFVFATTMPNSTETYNIDIQSSVKWIPFEKEIPLKR